MASGGTLPMVSGSFVGTGAIITVDTVGFRPKRVEFINITNDATGTWQDTFPDDAVHTQEDAAGAYAASDGVTPSDTGFALGTNAVLNTAAEEVHWTAYGD